jgi:hypothetical protein
MNRLYCVHPKDSYESVDIVSAKSNAEARYIASYSTQACCDESYIDIRAELIRPGDYYRFMNIRIDIIGEGFIKTDRKSGVLDWETEFIPLLKKAERANFVDESKEDLDDIITRLNTNVPADRTCSVCGCTPDHACPGGCYWVAEDLCSACAHECEEEDV